MSKSCLTTTLIVLSLFCSQMVAEAGQNSAATVHIDLDTATAGIQTTRVAAVNDTFDVDVVINGAVNLKTFNLVVTFPQAALEIQNVGVTEGEFLNKNGVTTTFLKDTSAAGKVEVTGIVLGTISDAEAADGDGVLAHLRFKVLSTQQADLTFSTSGSDTQLLRDNSGDTDDPVALSNASGATVNTLEAAKLAFTTSPSTSPAGANLSPTPVVTVQDAQGNTVTSSTASITIAIKTGTGTAGATLSGTKTVSAVNGVAIFSGLNINKMGSNYQLTATSTGLTSADSGAFDVISSTPIRLAFTTSPGETPAMAVLSPHPQVAIQDTYGNTVTSSTAPITVTSNKGTLSGTTTVNAFNGVATFQDLKIRPAGTSYQLNATSPGLNSADSQTFVITAEPALTIEKSDDVDPVDPNTEVIYTITYGNSGLAAAHSTVIVETLPANLTYVSSTDGGVYDEAAGTITWIIGTLDAETTGQPVSFTARVASTMLEGGTITNSVLAIDCDETELVGQITPETTTVNDKKAPSTSGHIPAKGSIQRARDTIIQMHITDGGSGVEYDGGTVTIQIEGYLVYDGANETSPGVYDSNSIHPEQVVRGICRRVGSEADYKFVFQPLTLFDYEQRVDVTVNATDEASNVMPQETYHFYTVMRSFGKNIKVNSDTGALVQNRPATAVDSAGNIWVAWDQTTAAGDTDIYIGQLEANGSVFGASVQITNDANEQSNPAIAIDSSDKMYVVWQGDDPNGYWDIFVSTSTDGTNWSNPPIKVNDGDPNNVSDQTSPAIAIDRATPNKAYVVWEDERNANKDIWLATSTDGTTWTPTQITTDANDQSEPAIAIDANNIAYVSWTDAGNSDTDIYGADSTTGPWTNFAVVNTVSNQSSPAGALSDDVIHLLWVDDADGYDDIFYGNDAGSLPFAGSSIIDEPNTAQIAPAIAVKSTGATTKVFACWQDARNVANNNADTDIYFAESGSDFGTNILVNDDVGTNTQSSPDIGIDKDGNPYMVWVDDRNGNNDIYYAGATTFTPLSTNIIVDPNDPNQVTIQASTVNGLQVTIPNLDDENAHIDPSTITIGEVRNLSVAPPTGGFGLMYNFGPTPLEFDPPATIRIPLDPNNTPSYSQYIVYRWDPNGEWTTGGIHNPATKSSDGTYLEVQVDHFSIFGTGGAFAGGGGGGGGCSMSPYGQGNVAEFLLPYVAYVIVLLAISWVDARRRRTKCNS